MGSEAKKLRTATFDVWTLDVWGHSADDCEKDHERQCEALASAWRAAGPCDCNRHEDCEGFTVNDRCRVGTIDIDTNEDGYPSDEAIFTALLDGGFIKSAVKLADMTIEDASCDGYMFDVDQASDGCPIFQVERTDPEGGAA